MRFQLTSVCLCLGAGMAGCFVPAETGKRMQADILALQQQAQTAERGLDEQKAALTEQMQRAEQQITEVSAALAELQRAARNTDADFGVQLERVIKELQELRGAYELSEYRLGKLEGRLEGEGSLTARVEALEKKPAEAPPPAVQDKKELLLQARALIKEGKAAEARGVLREVIKRWPKEAGVTDEARYRLGELYYDDKKFRNALPEYIAIAEGFASGAFADDALYKIGLCSMELGNLEDAQIFFTEVVKSHKGSPHAKASANKLDEIKARLEKEKKGGKKSGKR